VDTAKGFVFRTNVTVSHFYTCLGHELYIYTHKQKNMKTVLISRPALSNDANCGKIFGDL